MTSVISSSFPKILLAAAAALLVSVPIATLASGKMRTERLDQSLCETTGGGRFVGIPGFPGEKIDRRLKRDIKMLVRRYKIFITDGYSTDPVHSKRGEHPRGLALDIVPDTAGGGRWRDISRLARWAEPKQDQPRAPFRWVGYNGDAGHGRGHHLHLSWGHSKTSFSRPARTVYTVRCPRPAGGGKSPAPGPDGGAKPTEPTDRPTKGKSNGGSGGIAPSRDYRQQTAGGVTARRIEREIRRQQRSGASRERSGASLR